MKHKEMGVYLIAQPAIDWVAMSEWIQSLDGQAWLDRVDPEDGEGPEHDAEVLVEAAGRRCYQSWAPGINANVTKVREDSTAYLENIVNIGHGSVLEHAMFTFALEGISRVVTHELVRHRVGVAISQESLRYVRLTDIPFRHPDWIAEDDELAEDANDIIERIEAFQLKAARKAGLDDPGVSFHVKKTKTSDMRRYAPIGLLTGMVWSANVRTLRQTIEARTDAGAEREIRELFTYVGEVMLTEAPAIFSDFERVPVEGSDVPAWVPKRSKV
jgi:thymidylate synthase (FAD)